MDRAVISDQLVEQINNRKVLAALFTSYTFDPGFFELEVIPLLLDQSIAWSLDERIKRLSVREYLRTANLPIDIYYDLPMYRQSGEVSPQMEYLCHGVNLGNRAFHAKIGLVLVEDEEYGEQSLLVSAGSNNLTRAGWWDNIECQHWEEVYSGYVAGQFRTKLREDLEYLWDLRSFASEKNDDAIDRISVFLESCKASQSAEKVYYFGPSHLSYRRNFIDFLNVKQSPLRQFGNWQLEIISPFFADDVHSDEHQAFFEMGVQHVRLFLPRDDKDQALCSQEFFEHIDRSEGIEWGQWTKQLIRSLGIAGDIYRPLHAKVYHFYNGRQSWVFVGSVNFTYKALYENVEAGFFIKTDTTQPLLQPLNDTPSAFVLPAEEVPGGQQDDIEHALPEIHLCFNWLTQTLSGRTAKRKQLKIDIYNAEGDVIVHGWKIKYQQADYTGHTDKLQKALSNGSLVKVDGLDITHQSKPFAAHTVMLQQIGWTHKPINLPPLTTEQILSIYSGMSEESRQLLLIDAKIRSLILHHQAGELSTTLDEPEVYQFFSEYAEIFNAFRQLTKRMEGFIEQGLDIQVDYYLTGTGMDSLPSLVLKTASGDGFTEGVSHYLVLLSAKEIYRNPNFRHRSNVTKWLKQINEAIAQIKTGDSIVLKDNKPEKRAIFFNWFEKEFFKVYRQIEELEQ